MPRKSLFSQINERIKKFTRNVISKLSNTSNFEEYKQPIETQEVSKVDELQELKDKVQPVLDLANQRWSLLDEMGLRSLAISRAYDESGDRWGFDVSQLTDRGEIIAEATRARVFINDETSTVQGAELYSQQESYKQWAGQFGNQFNNWENKFKKFNISTISEEQAKVAFAAYRRLEESEAARIMSYGSENMIIAIYDMVVHTGATNSEDIQDVTDIAEQARDLLNREIGEKRAEFEKAFIEENQVGNILDVVMVEDDYFGRSMW